MTCNLGLSDWEPHDDTFKEHQDRAPICPFFDDITTSLNEARKAINAKRKIHIQARFKELTRLDAEGRPQIICIPRGEELKELDAKEAAIKAKEAAVAAQKAMERETAAAAAAAAAIEAAKPKATPKDIGFFDPTMTLDLPEFDISASSASFLHHLAESAAKYQERSVRKTLSASLRGPAHTWFKAQPKFKTLDSFKTALAEAFPPPPASEAIPDQAIINPSPPQYHRCTQCSMEFSSISRLLAHSQKGDCNKVTCKHCEEGFTSNNKLHEHVRLHHSQKSPPGPTTPKALHVRSGPDYPIKPPATPRSMTAVPEPLHQPITMVKAPVACPPTPPPTPPRSPSPSHQKSPKSYMTMDDLFAMFAGREKRSRKSLGTIQKRVRSPLPGQTKITSYFKPAGQPKANSPKSSPFTSSPCPAPRACFPANRSAGTPQYQNIATDAISNQGLQRRPKAPRQEYLVDAGVTHTNLGIRVGTTLTKAGGYKSVKSLTKSTKTAKLSKSPKSAVFTSSPSSAIRPYLPANSNPVTPQIADLQALIRANIKQLAYLLRLRASAAPDIGTSPPPAPP